MYAFHRTEPVKQKQWRRERYRFHASLVPQEWVKIQASSGVTMTMFSSAAVLWFDSLDREDQSRRVWTIMNSGLRRANKPLMMVEWVGDKFRGWHWPMATMGQVLAAALLGFSELPAEEKEQWCLEVMMPAGAAEPACA